MFSFSCFCTSSHPPLNVRFWSLGISKIGVCRPISIYFIACQNVLFWPFFKIFVWNACLCWYRGAYHSLFLLCICNVDVWSNYPPPQDTTATCTWLFNLTVTFYKTKHLYNLCGDVRMSLLTREIYKYCKILANLKPQRNTQFIYCCSE